MFKLNLPKSLVALAVAAAVSACGSGGGGGGGGGAAPPPVATTDVPASAQQSVSGLIAFMNGLIASTSETSEPILVGDAVLPVDDTAEPTPII